MGMLQQRTCQLLNTARTLKRMGYQHPMIDKITKEYADTSSYDYPQAKVKQRRPRYALVGSILVVENESAERTVKGSESMASQETAVTGETTVTVDTVVTTAT